VFQIQNRILNKMLRKNQLEQQEKTRTILT
jgi:hypothetical protein